MSFREDPKIGVDYCDIIPDGGGSTTRRKRAPQIPIRDFQHPPSSKSKYAACDNRISWHKSKPMPIYKLTKDSIAPVAGIRFEVVRHLVSRGVKPETIQPFLGKRRSFRSIDGICNSSDAVKRLSDSSEEGDLFDPGRYFQADSEVLHHDDRTYLFSNQWGTQTHQILEALAAKFPEHQIKIAVAE